VKAPTCFRTFFGHVTEHVQLADATAGRQLSKSRHVAV
jgi:hypothetical protein